MLHHSKQQRVATPAISLFEQLPAVIFDYIWTYLYLDTKCSRLPLLSHAVHIAFDPALCCRGHVKLELDEHDNAYPDVQQRAEYMKFASSIDIEWIRAELDTFMFSELAAALSQPNLTSLCFHEHLWSSSSLATATLLAYLSQVSPPRLKNLVTSTRHGKYM
jgi:hypothetical protein